MLASSFLASATKDGKRGWDSQNSLNAPLSICIIIVGVKRVREPGTDGQESSRSLFVINFRDQTKEARGGGTAAVRACLEPWGNGKETGLIYRETSWEKGGQGKDV